MRQKTRLGQQAPFIHISWVLCGREMPVSSLFLYTRPLLALVLMLLFSTLSMQNVSLVLVVLVLVLACLN